MFSREYDHIQSTLGPVIKSTSEAPRSKTATMDHKPTKSTARKITSISSRFVYNRTSKHLKALKEQLENHDIMLVEDKLRQIKAIEDTDMMVNTLFDFHKKRDGDLKELVEKWCLQPQIKDFLPIGQLEYIYSLFESQTLGTQKIVQNMNLFRQADQFKIGQLIARMKVLQTKLASHEERLVKEKRYIQELEASNGKTVEFQNLLRQIRQFEQSLTKEQQDFNVEQSYSGLDLELLQIEKSMQILSKMSTMEGNRRQQVQQFVFFGKDQLKILLDEHSSEVQKATAYKIIKRFFIPPKETKDQECLTCVDDEIIDTNLLRKIDRLDIQLTQRINEIFDLTDEKTAWQEKEKKMNEAAEAQNTLIDELKAKLLFFTTK